MSPFTRAVLIPILALSIPSGLAAQAESTGAVRAPETPESPVTAEETAERPADPADQEAPSSYQVRSQFTTLLLRSPRELATILVLDPALLTNDTFLADYPELSRFLAAYPEVRRNPRFYLGEFADRRDLAVGFDDLFEGILIFGVFLLVALALAWLVRTIIEQKRWNRLARTQSEVHNKILDRFGTSEELLDYVRSPAGSRFLESAPIPLHADGAAQNRPVSRVLWSIQIGVVVAATSLGMILVSGRLDVADARALFALGVIGLSVGVGFVASAFVSLVLARRLGLWATPPRPSATESAAGSDLMR